MKRLIIALVFTIVSLCAVSAQEHADSTATAKKVQDVEETVSSDKMWDMANTAYINGNYKSAIHLYEDILSGGQASVKLYYNLGNAYFKDKELARSILNYHRALRLAPGNEDIRYNLKVAEARTKDTIEDIPEFFMATWIRSLHHIMRSAAWTILSLVFLVAALSLFLVYLLSQRLSLRKTGFYGTMVAALLFALTTWFAVAERNEIMDQSSAVVMPATAAVKSSPDASAIDLFLLHEGTVVEITNHLDKWSEIVIRDGKKGWVESDKIEVI